jgi:hypothetical protein
VNELETDVRTRLHRLANDVLLDDPRGQAGRARVRYRRQRRARAGLVTAAAAVVAIVVGVPMLASSLSAPGGGEVAHLPTTAPVSSTAAPPSDSTDHEDRRNTSRWADTLENRAERDARLGPVADRLRTALASHVPPISLPAPERGAECPDWSAALSSILGTRVTGGAGAVAAAGCTWTGAGVSVDAGFAAGASQDLLVLEVDAEASTNGCYPTALPGTELFTGLALCEQESSTRWELRVLASGGTGFWRFSVVVNDRIDGAQATAAVLNLADATW